MTDRASFIGVFHLWSTSVFSWGSGMQKYVYLPTGGSWTRDLWRHCGAPFCLLAVAKCSIDIILPSCKIWINLRYNEPTHVGLCLSICWYGVLVRPKLAKSNNVQRERGRLGVSWNCVGKIRDAATFVYTQQHLVYVQ